MGEKNTLGLNLATDPRWVDIASKNMQDILVDHAWCEQKAASSCISLIIKYPENRVLVERLTPVVAEEWSHFERVLAKLKQRGWALGFPRKDEYVEKVMAMVKKGGSREQQLVENLLINALIEARSCERFRILWKEIGDPDLADFYHELMISEAGHYKNFLTLAKEFADADAVEERWKELLAGEAKILNGLTVRGDRMH